MSATTASSATRFPWMSETIASRTGLRRARVLEHQRHALPRPHAHAEHAVAGLAQAQLGGEREHVAGAGRAERGGDRDRPAVWVQAVVGDLEAAELVRQLAQDAKRLGGVRL